MFRPPLQLGGWRLFTFDYYYTSRTQKWYWDSPSFISISHSCVCKHKLEPYMGPVPQCCSDEQGWSSSARCHGNVREGFELCCSPMCHHSSVSPRHWLGKGTERKRLSGKKKNRQLSHKIERINLGEADISDPHHSTTFNITDQTQIRQLNYLLCHNRPAPDLPGRVAGQQPPQRTAFVSEHPALGHCSERITWTSFTPHVAHMLPFSWEGCGGWWNIKVEGGCSLLEMVQFCVPDVSNLSIGQHWESSI